MADEHEQLLDLVENHFCSNELTMLVADDNHNPAPLSDGSVLPPGSSLSYRVSFGEFDDEDSSKIDSAHFQDAKYIGDIDTNSSDSENELLKINQRSNLHKPHFLMTKKRHKIVSKSKQNRRKVSAKSNNAMYKVLKDFSNYIINNIQSSVNKVKDDFEQITHQMQKNVIDTMQHISKIEEKVSEVRINNTLVSSRLANFNSTLELALVEGCKLMSAQLVESISAGFGKIEEILHRDVSEYLDPSQRVANVQLTDTQIKTIASEIVNQPQFQCNKSTSVENPPETDKNVVSIGVNTALPIPTCVYTCQSASDQIVQSDAISKSDFVTAVDKVVRQVRIPPPVPSMFDGDQSKYSSWRRSMSHLLHPDIPESDKLSYLMQYLSNDIQNDYKIYLQDSIVGSSQKVLEKLDERFGDSYSSIIAYIKELEEWPVIPDHDPDAFRSFSDFLTQVYEVCAADTNDYIYLDNLNRIKLLLEKLPDEQYDEFLEFNYEYKEQHEGAYPGFKEFSDFVADCSRTVNDPVFKSVLQKFADPEVRAKFEGHEEHSYSDNNVLLCPMCPESHTIPNCPQFNALRAQERVVKAIDLDLCLRCLRPNHISKTCDADIRCQSCDKGHHSLLHHSKCMKQMRNILSVNRQERLSDSGSGVG